MSRRRRVARIAFPRGLRIALFAAATVYLLSVWIGSAGSALPRKLLPRPLLYFTQTSCLFPHAGVFQIEYRAEAWLCDSGRFEPLDVRPAFPIRADDKENRFHRAMFFFRRNRPLMRELDAYVTGFADRRRKPRVGGVRFSSLRIPFPEVGDELQRYRYRPIDDYPPRMRKPWYWTPASTRTRRCGESP